jgi:hypothetical protein
MRVVQHVDIGWRNMNSWNGPANSLGVVFTSSIKEGYNHMFSYYYDVYAAIKNHPAVVDCGVLQVHGWNSYSLTPKQFQGRCSSPDLPKIVLVTPATNIWIYQVKQTLWVAKHFLSLHTVFIANRIYYTKVFG